MLLKCTISFDKKIPLSSFDIGRGNIGGGGGGGMGNFPDP